MNFTTKISNSSGLTNGQEKALELLYNWFKSDSPAFSLSGRAGTGKTYVINYFLNAINTTVCVTAPTHKAVRIIESMTGRKGKTLHSLHGLRPNVNLDTFDLNNPQFDALAIPSMQNYKLIVCDECGMINSALHSLNIKRAMDMNVKILYVGDQNQLPPVKERLSPTFLLKDNYELTEIVRQAHDNPLMPILDLLVDDIKNNSANFLYYLIKNRENINSNKEGYKFVTNITEFHNLAFNHFKSDDFSKNTDYCRMSGWKNDTVKLHNDYIRHQLIPYFTNSDNSVNSKIDIVDINDIFTGYKTLMDEYNNATLINSEDYIVKSVKPSTNYNFKCFDIDLVTRVKRNPISIKIVDYTDQSFVTYYEKIKTLYFKALYAPANNRSTAWKTFFEFKNTYLTLVSFDIKYNGETKTTITKDIDYGFALTTHKLQGSTVENMFINLHDILYYSNGRPVLNSENNPYAVELRNKLVYTAISRTSKNAYIYFPLT